MGQTYQQLNIEILQQLALHGKRRSSDVGHLYLGAEEYMTLRSGARYAEWHFVALGEEYFNGLRVFKVLEKNHLQAAVINRNFKWPRYG